MDVNLVLFAPAIALFFYYVGKKIHKFYVFKQTIDKIPGPNFGLSHFGMAFRLITVPKKGKYTLLISINLLVSVIMTI